MSQKFKPIPMCVTSGGNGQVKFWDLSTWMNFASAADLRYQREQNPIFEQWNVSELTKDENFIFFGGHSGKLMVINFNKVRQILAESKIMAQSRDGQNRNLPQTKAICEPDKVITRLPPPDKKSQNNVVSIEAFIKSEV